MAMAPSPLTGGVCALAPDVVETSSRQRGFLKLAGDKGWVFDRSLVEDPTLVTDKTRTGTFCVPVGSEWQDWRGLEGHKAWTANNRDRQHGSWNNAPSGNGRDRGGDKRSRSSSFWEGQEDKWAWDQNDRDGWRHEQQHAGTSTEWMSWGCNGQNKTESHNIS